MASHSDAPSATWAFFSNSHQLDAPVENEFQNEQFEMSSFAESRASRDASRYSLELVQRNDENMTKARSLSLRRCWHRLYSRWQRMCGYRFGVLYCAGIVGTIFLINLILTIWAWKTYGVNAGFGTIQHGNCAQTKKLSLWLHFAINIFGTAMLSASNYVMQCLSSPTRQDINNAHVQNIWLDIGILSVRNLKKISWKRTVLWCLLALSSLPLHLVYNSAVFETLTTHKYDVYIVSKDFVFGAPFNISRLANITTLTSSVYDVSTAYSMRQLSSFQNSDSGVTLRNLTTRNCILTYGNPFGNSKYGDVLAVSSIHNATDSLLHCWTPGRLSLISQNNLWFRDGQKHSMYCDVDKAANAPLTVANIPIDYCLVQEIDEKCMLQFSLPLMLIIIVSNLIKLICMILVVLKLKGGSRPLLTVGDAIASFLDEPDPFTKNICLADKYFFQKKPWRQYKNLSWKLKRYRWFRAASITRWFVCNVLCILTLVTTTVLLNIGLRNTSLVDKSISHLWKLGFGAVNSESVINIQFPGRGIMAPILLANAPQIVLSFLFLTYNGLFTNMLLAEEWSGFAHERKTLRVSWPVDVQRSTFWLQLPYKYGIPLLIISGILHWLVSQSIFFVHVIQFDRENQIDLGNLISTCGYSNIAIISVIILGSIILLLEILAGSRKYKAGMPFVGSCSAAISAACHAPKDDPTASLLPLMWGAVKTEENSIKHCCFSSLDVSPPVEGEVYAGVEEMMNSDHTQDNVKQLVKRVTE